MRLLAGRFDDTTIFSQACDEAEFRWLLASPSSYTVVAWQDDEVVGFAGLTRSLKGSPYFNESFIEARFPDRYRAQAVHYCWGLCVDESADQGRSYQAIVKAIAGLAMREDFVVLFDVPSDVVEGLPRSANAFYRVASIVGEVTLEEVGRQRMFALTPCTSNVNQGALPDIVDLRNGADVIDLAERKSAVSQ